MGPRGGSLGVLALLGAALLSGAVHAQETSPASPPRIRYVLDAVLDPDELRLEGVVRFTLRNTSRRPLESIFLFTYPNRYSKIDPEMTDEIWDRVYPSGFSPGELLVQRVVVGGADTRFVFPHRRYLGPRALMRVDLERPLAAGGRADVEVAYTLAIPERFGSFGAFDGQITMNGGWYPYLPALHADGGWGLREPPPPAEFEMSLRVRRGGHLIVNGRHRELADGGAAPVEMLLPARYLSLAFRPRTTIYRHECSVDRITWYQTDDRPGAAEDFLTDLHQGIAFLPEVGAAPERWEIPIVEAPLRRDLYIVGDGMMFISDRFLDILIGFETFHIGPAVEGVFTTALRPVVERREAPEDVYWVSEAAAWIHALAFYEDLKEAPEAVKGLLGWIDFIPAIDRLLEAPRFPFVRAFFGDFYEMDPLREDITRFNAGRPPGRIIMEKMRDLLGGRAVREIAVEVLRGDRTIRDITEEKAGEDMGWFFGQWRMPYPRVNYRLVDSRSTLREDGTYRTEVTIRREGAPVREPVGVRVRELLGEEYHARWDGRGEEGVVELSTARPAFATRLDPRRRLREVTTTDNGKPPTLKVLLNRIRVRIDLNGRDSEADIGTTFIINNDYSRRYDVSAFTKQQQDGLALNVTQAFGRALDPTEFTQAVGLGYAATQLDAGFAQRKSGRLNDEGRIGILTTSYRTKTTETRRSPLTGGSFAVWAQYSDRYLGSDFRFWKAGLNGEYIVPVVRDRHLLAVKGDVGVADPGGTPTQLLFDIGGSSGIRGINTGLFLGTYLWQTTAEYRLVLLDHLDVNLATLAWVRRFQIASYFEIGNVTDESGDLFLRDRLLYGWGIGVRLHLDAFGVFPNVWRFDVAWRLDEPDGPLFYIGGGQSF